MIGVIKNRRFLDILLRQHGSGQAVKHFPVINHDAQFGIAGHVAGQQLETLVKFPAEELVGKPETGKAHRQGTADNYRQGYQGQA